MHIHKKLLLLATIISCNLSTMHAAADDYQPKTPPRSSSQISSRRVPPRRTPRQHAKSRGVLTPVPFVLEDHHPEPLSAPEEFCNLLAIHIQMKLIEIELKDDADRTTEEVAFYRAHTADGQMRYADILPIYEAAEITWRDTQTKFLSEFFTEATSLMSHTLVASHNRKRIEAPAPRSHFEMIHQQFEAKYHPEFYLSLIECLLTFELALEHKLCIRDALDWTLAYIFRDDLEGSGSESETDSQDYFLLADD